MFRETKSKKGFLEKFSMGGREKTGWDLGTHEGQQPEATVS
jgi:hypothetical protein